jgi:DNA-binding LacI/PurR family transcriptional regulator
VTPSSRQPTILDVARRAGVSTSTVSNVIRGAGKTSDATRERVLRAIADVSYRPNAIARSLVRQRTTTVGILVGDLANPFYSELAKLVEQRLTAAGYATMICNTDGHVPADVSVVGFDDIALAGLARVSLTTVAQPREELAELGSSIMLERIESGELAPLRQARLEPTLVVRSSTGRAAR